MESSASGVTLADAAELSANALDEGAWHRLTVTCDDRAGLLADLSEHLRAHGVDIVSAAVATDTDSGQIVDTFAVRGRERSAAARSCRAEVAAAKAKQPQSALCRPAPARRTRAAAR
jgi:UTP:GlnB (protein PII) uridylyltransferase